jgi:superfamily II DNA helicase RecQ
VQYRVFAVPAVGSPDLEEELNRFLRSHRVISVQKTAEQVDGVLRWCFCVEYLEGVPAGSGSKQGGGSARVDYKQVLSEDDFAIFARLRDVRKALAASEAAPVYSVCTNEQLAAMARERPVSLAQLREIDGFGQSKAAKYGSTFLQALNGNREGQDEASGKPD